MVNNQGIEYPLYVDSFLDNGDKIWFVNYNALCNLDKETGEIFIEDFLSEKMKQPYLFRCVVQCKNKIVFVPAAAKAVVIFDLESHMLFQIAIKAPVSLKHIPYSEGNKFMTAAVWKNYVFLVGSTYPAIIRMNIQTFEMEYLYDIHKKLDEMDGKSTIFFGGQCLTEDNMLYIPAACADLVLKLDMENLQYEFVIIDHNNGNYVGICKNQEEIWLTGTARRLVRYSLRDKSHEIFKIPIDYDGVGSPYVKITYYTGKIYLYGYNVCTHFVFDLEKKEFEELKFQNTDSLDGKNLSFPYLVQKGDGLQGYCINQKCIMQIQNGNQISKIYFLKNRIEILERLRKEKLDWLFKKNFILKENIEYNLELYLAYMRES